MYGAGQEVGVQRVAPDRGCVLTAVLWRIRVCLAVLYALQPAPALTKLEAVGNTST